MCYICTDFTTTLTDMAQQHIDNGTRKAWGLPLLANTEIEFTRETKAVRLLVRALDLSHYDSEEQLIGKVAHLMSHGYGPSATVAIGSKVYPLSYGAKVEIMGHGEYEISVPIC